MRRGMILLAIVLVAMTMIACGAWGSACSSTYPGCEETAIVIATKWAAPLATATAWAAGQ